MIKNKLHLLLGYTDEDLVSRIGNLTNEISN
jgi:hypothetical protein